MSATNRIIDKRVKVNLILFVNKKRCHQQPQTALSVNSMTAAKNLLVKGAMRPRISYEQIWRGSFVFACNN